MSLNDILEIERSRLKREKVVLNTVYDRLKNKINNSVRVKSKECVYTIPEFIPGYPLIDIHNTMQYLLAKLEIEGFIAFPITQLDIYITWDPVKIRELDQIKKGKEAVEPKEKKPTKTVLEKEFERANEDFINNLIISKKRG